MQTTNNGQHQFAVEAVDAAGNVSGSISYSWKVAAGSIQDFTITGSTNDGNPATDDNLYPGGPAVPVNLVFTNPNSVPITVQSATVVVTVTGVTLAGPGTCNSADFTIPHQLLVDVVVPANSTKSLATLVADRSKWPTILMADNGPQNGCINATVNLHFTGQAQG